LILEERCHNITLPIVRLMIEPGSV
jgi:hypothetical protein